jgi:4-diphosphocytidyl-2-C-methyl-D-erythritol kinase
MVKLLSELAPAKINLFLRITGRRADGYHELDSLFAPIGIFDRLALDLRPAASSSVALRCNWPELSPLSENLAARAAIEFMREFELDLAVAIDLAKSIPAGAGLGGGSSDAAAVLRGMAHLCRIDDSTRLHQIALRLGADVSFFIHPAPARIGGIGERIEFLADFPAYHLVIAVPPINVSTAAVFKNLARDGWSGRASEKSVRALLDGVVAPESLHNDLAPIAIAQYPEIARLNRALERSGACGASMSGSGGAVFGVFRSAADALGAAAYVRAEFPSAQVFATRILSR